MYPFFQMFGRRRKPSARPSLLIFLTDRPIARISSSLVLYRVPRSDSFTLAKSRPRWSSGYHTRLWIRGSRVRSRPGSMDFSGP